MVPYEKAEAALEELVRRICPDYDSLYDRKLIENVVRTMRDASSNSGPCCN
jgi:hypothetical protein